MIHRLVPSIALALLAVTACGGDDTPKRAATAEEGDAFCEAAEDLEAAGEDLNDLDPLSASAADLEEAYRGFTEQANDLAKLTPTDLDEDFSDLLKMQGEFIEVLEDNDWDFAETFADEDNLELAQDLEEAGDDYEEYLADKCDIEQDDVSESTSPDDAEGTVPEGLVTKDNFLDLFAIGADVEITDEMRDCFSEAIEDLSDEDLNAAINGSASDDVTTTVGLAILTCEIPIPG